VISYSAGESATTGNSINFGPLTLSPGSGDALPPIFDTYSTVYWRVGAAVTTDHPGPVPDYYTHEPYIFSSVSFFTKQTSAAARAKTPGKITTVTSTKTSTKTQKHH